jgi:hypothetical protein
MSLQDITITASINSIATQSYGQRTYIASTNEQSFPIEHITGSQAGSFPNFVHGTDYTVDLIVNITQSWSGSNTTPLGIVPYVHNTMEEFVNGEFSGSNYVVSNGNLNDAQCEQFLTVSTVPTSYSIFPYSVYRVDGVIYGTSQFGVFINDLTAPPNGGILLFKEDDDITDVPPTVKYVKITYLKISRFDQEGNDNTLSLQELTSIRWTDSEPTAGEIILNVLNITEYPTYYLYAVSSKTWVNPLYIPGDDNTLNYSLSASFNGISAPAGTYYLNNWTVYNVSGGTFNTYYYTFDVTPNIVTRYTASITATNYNVSSVTFDFGFWGNTYTGTEISYTPIALTQSVTIPSGQTKTFRLSGSTNSSFIGNPNVQYHLETNNLNAPISLSNTFWIVTHSVAPQTATSSVVIEPYLLSTFTDSDCDVLMNNYSENDYSNFYRAVLYDNGGTIPSNLKQIISGTAQFAEVNDYLYEASANRLPRYEGVRTTSAGFNLPSQDGLTNEQLANIQKSSNLIINNGTPNVQNTTTYFGYFTSLKANWPIFKGTTSPVLKYLIREDGTVFNPAADEATYYNMIDSFPRDTKAYTNLLYNTTTIFNSTQSILLSGESYTPIMYNLSAATNTAANFTSSISFQNLQGTTVSGTPPNYNFKASDPIIGTSLYPSNVKNIFYSGLPTIYIDVYPGWYNTSTAYDGRGYQFNGVPLSPVKINVGANFKLENTSNYYQVETATCEIKLYYKRSSTDYLLSSNIETIFTTQDMFLNWQDAVGNVGIAINNWQPLPGDILFATFEVISISSNASKPVILNTSAMNITTLGLTIPSAGPIFWTTGSSFDTVLTSSAALGEALQGNYIQIDITGSGFDPIENECTIKVGDEFRFEYNESNTFRVTDVLITGSGGTNYAYVTVTPPIPPAGINLNQFTVRRKIKDYITGITLDADLIIPIQEGFILPEYPSTDLKKNLSKIINDLSQKNVI